MRVRKREKSLFFFYFSRLEFIKILIFRCEEIKMDKKKEEKNQNDVVYV